VVSEVSTGRRCLSLAFFSKREENKRNFAVKKPTKAPVPGASFLPNSPYDPCLATGLAGIRQTLVLLQFN
jgi:hypothetical protein